jgi:hypothetical protein
MTVTNHQNYPQFPAAAGGGSSGLVLIDGELITASVPWLGSPTLALPLSEDYLYFRLRCGVAFNQAGRRRT